MKSIPIIILVLCLSQIAVATSIYGGESLIYNFDKCDKLHIDIIPSEVGEWNISNCTETFPGLFNCICSDNYILKITSAVNSVGNFNITINNYLFKEVNVHHGHSGVIIYNVSNLSNKQNLTLPIEVIIDNLPIDNITIPVEQIPENVVVPLEVVQENNITPNIVQDNKGKTFIIILVILCIILLMVYLMWRYREYF